MPDNVTLNAGSGGATVASDDVGGVQYQKVKLVEGADGVDDGTISASNPLPVDSELPAAAALAENMANPTAPLVGACLAAFDGTTWDRVTNGGGTEATALRVTIANDSTGLVSVDDNGGNISVDWAGTVPPIGSGTEAAALRVAIATDSTIQLEASTNNIGDVDVLTLPALVAGTANIGDVDVLTIAAGDNNIGNVDIVTMPNVTLTAGTNTNEVVGDAAHDATAAGNPVSIGGISQDMDDTAPPNQVSAEGEATRLACDRDGALFVRLAGPRSWDARLTGLIAADTSVKTAPGAGLSLYVTDVIFSIGAATASSILLEEGTTTAKFGPHYLEAVSGRGLAMHFVRAIKIAANTALTATGTGSTTATLDVYGFTAAG